MNFFARYLNINNSQATAAKMPVRSSTLFNATTLTVGGGKGGVGKSLVAANLGVHLSKMGNKVLMVDADLGAANMHTFLGVAGSARPFSSFLKGGTFDIRDVITKTRVPSLDMISGARDAADIADITDISARLRESFRRVDYDYIILDAGPGTSAGVLDFFLMSDEGILVLTPEPTSIDNTYRFLKCLIMRKLNKAVDLHGDIGLKDLVRKGFDENWTGTFVDAFERFKKVNLLHGSILESIKNNIKISIVVNQARKPEDKEIGPFIKRACYDYFGVDIKYLGHIGYDECVIESIKSQQPLAIRYSQAAASRDIEACFLRLVTQGGTRAGRSERG